MRQESRDLRMPVVKTFRRDKDRRRARISQIIAASAGDNYCLAMEVYGALNVAFQSSESLVFEDADEDLEVEVGDLVT